MMRSQIQKRTATALTLLLPLRRAMGWGSKNRACSDQFTELPSLEMASNFLVERIKTVTETNHPHSSGATPYAEQFATILKISGQRLFQIKMLAAAQSSNGGFSVKC